jgi:hypothetical protein
MDFAISVQTDEEFAAAKAELSALVGEEQASRPSLFSRLIRRPDGLKIRVMQAQTDLRSQLITNTYGPTWFEKPWLADAPFLQIQVLELPLKEGLDLLNSDRDPEREIRRRREKTREHEEEIAKAKQAAIQQAAELEKKLREDAARDIKLRRAEWEGLPDHAKWALAIALDLEDGLTPAAALRALAATRGSLRFPGRKWWSK